MWTGGKEVEFNFLDKLETGWMLSGNLSNMVVLFITQFKDNNSVGVFSISLSLELIVLSSDLIYTPLFLDKYI